MVEQQTVKHWTDEYGALELRIERKYLGHFREMIRQQLLGDLELLRDCVSGREDPEMRLIVGTRIEFLRGLAAQVGVPEDPERRRDPSRVQQGTLPPRPGKGLRLRLYRWLLGMD